MIKNKSEFLVHCSNSKGRQKAPTVVTREKFERRKMREVIFHNLKYLYYPSPFKPRTKAL